MEKVNIAELLKDCPKGMELDCASYDNVSFDKISDDKKATYPIFCYITDEEGNRSGISFTENGCESKRYGAKCVIFPKGKTTWKGFQRPFKDGDIIYNKLHKKICIYYLCGDGVHRIRGCRYNESNIQLQFEKLEYPIPIAIKDYRLATEEEKSKLFDAIKANGYRWNPETKHLEKLIEPKFKVGDKITMIDGSRKGEIYYIDVDKYHVAVSNIIGIDVFFEDQDNWELVPNKFDITTLVPFESRVLMRSSNAREWTGTIFSHYSNNKFYGCGMCCDQCIPYEGNEHLLGTTDDCDEYFKTWK